MTEKPASQTVSKPAIQATSKPVSQPVSKPAATPASQPAAKTAVQDVLPKTSDIVKATKQELQNKQNGTVSGSQQGGWKSKNFLTDDDDLEFDFLDMDEN